MASRAPRRPQKASAQRWNEERSEHERGVTRCWARGVLAASGRAGHDTQTQTTSSMPQPSSARTARARSGGRRGSTAASHATGAGRRSARIGRSSAMRSSTRPSSMRSAPASTTVSSAMRSAERPRFGASAWVQRGSAVRRSSARSTPSSSRSAPGGRDAAGPVEELLERLRAERAHKAVLVEEQHALNASGANDRSGEDLVAA